MLKSNSGLKFIRNSKINNAEPNESGGIQQLTGDGTGKSWHYNDNTYRPSEIGMQTTYKSASTVKHKWQKVKIVCPTSTKHKWWRENEMRAQMVVPKKVYYMY